MPTLRTRSKKRQAELSPEVSKETSQNEKVTCVVRVTPISDNVECHGTRQNKSDDVYITSQSVNVTTSNLDSSPTVSSAARRLDAIKKENNEACCVLRRLENFSESTKEFRDTTFKEKDWKKAKLNTPEQFKNIEKENMDAEDLTDSSDLIDTSDEDGDLRMKRIVEERDRVKQSKQEILKKLAIAESTKEISDTISKEKKWRNAKRRARKQLEIKNKKTLPVIQRKSLRLLRKDPNGIDVPPEPMVSPEEARNPGTQFPMTAVGFEIDDSKPDDLDPEEVIEMEKSFADYNNFMKGLSNMHDIPDFLCQSSHKVNTASYQKDLQSMKIIPEHAQKVTRRRIFSLAIHPSLTEVLVAAGDHSGNLGLWTPLDKDSNQGTYTFTPHVKPISCLKFSALNSNKLFMCSYDGQLRSMDLQKMVFEKALVDDEDATMSGFDFMHSNTTLVTSRSDGCVSIVDTRVSQADNAVLTFEAHNRAAKSISCHPLQKYYISTAHRDSSVFIFDVRQVSNTQKQCKPIAELEGHSRSVSSAYFSPLTGNRVLTTSYDNRLRVFDTSVISPDEVKLTSSCYHNNNTGRWLSSFRATWHPSSDSLFVIGSMERPRQIDLYNSSAKAIHTLREPEIVTSVCAVNCFHESRDIIVGGNSAGKLFMFSHGI